MSEGSKLVTEAEQEDGLLARVVVGLAFLFTLLTFPITAFFCFKAVAEYERAVIFRLGRVRRGPRGPGLFFVLPFVDYFYLVLCTALH
jgi:erythrocyte band 7 integral membrane protein